VRGSRNYTTGCRHRSWSSPLAAVEKAMFLPLTVLMGATAFILTMAPMFDWD
jgi:hypothetical protein